MIDAAGRSRGSRRQKEDTHTIQNLSAHPVSFVQAGERRGRRAGWVEKSERQGHGHSCAKYLNNVPPLHALPFLFTLLQSHHPERQEAERLPFDMAGMFSSSVPAAAAAAAECPSRADRVEPVEQHCDLLHCTSIPMCGVYRKNLTSTPAVLNLQYNHITHSLCVHPTKYERMSEKMMPLMKCDR